MNHYAAWKNLLIVFFLFILGLYALPNLYGSDLAIQISGSGNYDVSERDLDKINDTLSDNGVDFKSISLEGQECIGQI
jgi:preprotein translocase subunit SecD